MRKTWKNLTGIARPIWKAAFNDEPWPTGWKVYSVPWMRGAGGLTCYGQRRILINRSDHRVRKVSTRHMALAPGAAAPVRPAMNILHTLIHEFVHVRCQELRHGKEFERLIEAAYARVWEGR